jgi:hypothetical protein
MTEAGLTYNQTLQLCIVEEQQVELDLQRASELHSILPHTAEVKTYQINLAEGYQTEPPLESRLFTQSELQAVEGFTIWNEHGSIEFTTPVDLTDVDLAIQVSI